MKYICLNDIKCHSIGNTKEKHSWNNKEEWSPPQLHKWSGGHMDVTLLSIAVTSMWHGFYTDVTECDRWQRNPQRHPSQDNRPPFSTTILVWFGTTTQMPKSQNARLWLLSLKVALLRLSWTQTHLIIITHFQILTWSWNPYRKFLYQILQHVRMQQKILTESSDMGFFSMWGGKPVENMLAYRKFLQVLELFNNVLKTPEGLQLDCKWIVYKLT